MKAFTVITPHADWPALAARAAEQLQAHAPIANVSVVLASDHTHACKLQLSTLLRFTEPVCLFDADWWLVAPIMFPRCIKISEGILATPTHSKPDSYKDHPTFNPARAFSTAFVCLNMGQEANRRVVERAIVLQSEDRSPRRTERHFSIAAQEHLPQEAIQILPTRFNWCDAPLPPYAAAIHAAGRVDKLSWLTQHCPQPDVVR